LASTAICGAFSTSIKASASHMLYNWDTCRFIMGSTKMLAVALGKSEADEIRTNLSQLSARLKGQVSLDTMCRVRQTDS
jgi:hypothetical protein